MTVTEVHISVASAFPWSAAISPSGAGFSNVLQAMVALRQRNRAPPDLYYVGLFAPGDTFDDYCGASCVTGLNGVLTNPQDSVGRASVALGFTGLLAAQTAAHEIGHAHGRAHSPCGGATNPDPTYPHANGAIGVWGYDLGDRTLIRPSFGDVMSYCVPAWISDWTYNALFNRISTVNAAMSRVAQSGTARYRTVSVEADGSLHWGETLSLAEPPANEPRTVRYVDAAGVAVATATGHFYPYEGVPGGYLLVPEGPVGFAKIVVSNLGASGTRELRRP